MSHYTKGSLHHITGRQMGFNVPNFQHKLINELYGNAKELYHRNLCAHYGCVNAIEFSQKGDHMISGGDDRRILLWNLGKTLIDRADPLQLITTHQSNIFCLGLNYNGTKVFSGGNDDTVIVHDLVAVPSYDVYLHTNPVYGLSVEPIKSNIFATANEDGRIFVFDVRQGSGVMILPKSTSPFHGVQFHPLYDHFIATANSKDGAALWDLRDISGSYLSYGGLKYQGQSYMSVCFNKLGTQLVGLRQRLPPVLFHTLSEVPICQFYHTEYYNSCTMKKGCFAGQNDEYILSGSDDFNLYMWSLKNVDLSKSEQLIENHHIVLKGHRSIVNQVRYNPQRSLIASCGVEKLIKIWQPFEANDFRGTTDVTAVARNNVREVYSQDDYMTIAGAPSENINHDYTTQSTIEDPRMIAFFDTLVQREIESWNTYDNDSSDDDYNSHVSSDNCSRSSESSESSDDNDNENENGNNNNSNNNNNNNNDRTVDRLGPDNVNRGVPQFHFSTLFFSTPTGYYVSERRGARNGIPKRYSHRIAYLISTKEKALKRLALKGASQTAIHNRNTRFNSRRSYRGATARFSARNRNYEDSTRPIYQTARIRSGNHTEEDNEMPTVYFRTYSSGNLDALNLNLRPIPIRRKFWGESTESESTDTNEDDDENPNDSTDTHDNQNVVVFISGSALQPHLRHGNIGLLTTEYRNLVPPPPINYRRSGAGVATITVNQNRPVLPQLYEIDSDSDSHIESSVNIVQVVEQPTREPLSILQDFIPPPIQSTSPPLSPTNRTASTSSNAQENNKNESDDSKDENQEDSLASSQSQPPSQLQPPNNRNRPLQSAVKIENISIQKRQRKRTHSYRNRSRLYHAQNSESSSDEDTSDDDSTINNNNGHDANGVADDNSQFSRKRMRFNDDDPGKYSPSSSSSSSSSITTTTSSSSSSSSSEGNVKSNVCYKNDTKRNSNVKPPKDDDNNNNNNNNNGINPNNSDGPSIKNINSNPINEVNGNNYTTQNETNIIFNNNNLDSNNNICRERLSTIPRNFTIVDDDIFINNISYSDDELIENTTIQNSKVINAETDKNV